MSETLLLALFALLVIVIFRYIQVVNHNQARLFKQKLIDELDVVRKTPNYLHEWVMYRDKVGFYTETYLAKPDEDMSECDCDICSP